MKMIIMKKKYSSHWVSSKQPRKQRKYRYNAPLHRRQAMVSAHLSKELRKAYKRRSMTLRKGDEVRIMKGEFRGTFGKIEDIDLQKLKVTIENVKKRKITGQEMPARLDPSNLLITKLELGDKKRLRRK
jgi:large subunit ribosomal protein L24